MSNFSRVISFGSSTTRGSDGVGLHQTWSAIIANKLGVSYECQAKPSCSNSKIARKILSYTEYNNDLVVVMWTSPNRYEFKTPNGWNGFTPHSKSDGFVKAWFDGPGDLEYTEVSMTLKDIVLAQQFLKSKNLPYLFAFDNNMVIESYVYNTADGYITALKNLIDWDNFLLFDNQGLIPWSRTNNFDFIDTHPGPAAHAAAAEYILLTGL
jgi:hypothetical protein